MSIVRTYKQLTFPIFIPTLFFSISMEASLVLIPLYVLKLGYGPAIAALVVSVRGMGMLLTDIPVGFLISRSGDKAGMGVGTAGNALSLLFFAVFSNPILFCIGSIISGSALSAWLVARLSFVGEACPYHERGRILAFMASLQRIGGIVGPLIGGWVASSHGYPVAFTVVAVVACCSVLGILLFCRKSINSKNLILPGTDLLSVLGTNKKAFLTSGVGVIGLLSLRGIKPMIIPLFGNGFGLSPVEIGGIVSLTMIIDFLMFIPAGLMMDRFGRKMAAIPATLAMAVGLVVLSLSSSLIGFTCGTFLMALGSGLATGVPMAISADLAPPEGKGQFLGVWRFVSDIGFSGAPILFTALISILSISTSSILISVLSSGCAYIMWRFSPESMNNSRI